MKIDRIDVDYPITDPTAPIIWMESPYQKGAFLKQGHCNGPVGTTYHSGYCTILSWHRQSSTWMLCACDCHEQTQDQLREIALGLHGKTTEGRARMSAKPTTKKSTAARTKTSTTAARAPKACMCECGDSTKGGRFLPGHDAKLKSRLQAAHREARTKRERDKIETSFHSLKWGKFIPSV